jgi:RimJ/RimL family protein N-acetyltransferase
MVFLRDLTRSDILYINTWRNDKVFLDSLGSPFRFINLESDYEWFENYSINRSKQVRCSVIEKETNELIGVVYLLNIDLVSRSADFGIMIFPPNQGKGFGKTATLLMIEHGFLDLNLNRISLTVLCENLRAISLYKSVGFEKEGRLRESIYKNGEFKDQYIMSVLKADFDKKDLMQKGK